MNEKYTEAEGDGGTGGKEVSWPLVFLFGILVVIALLMILLMLSITNSRNKHLSEQHSQETPQQAEQTNNQTSVPPEKVPQQPATEYVQPLAPPVYSGPCTVYFDPVLESTDSIQMAQGVLSVWGYEMGKSNTGVLYDGTNQSMPYPRFTANAQDTNGHYLWVSWDATMNTYFQCTNVNGDIDSTACAFEGWIINDPNFIKSDPPGCTSSLTVRTGTIVNLEPYEWQYR